jgi:23S rRNA (adenine2030-N6)-methyltransferase
MLSYQHSYHAGNLADAHKHRLLAERLSGLALYSQPLTYMETHAGRGVYDLGGAEARKTGEAQEGEVAWRALPDDHPYRTCITATRARYGKESYPGSPQIARLLLRASDRLHLFEKHPQEYAALTARIKGKNLRMHRQDGYSGVLRLASPALRQGIVLVDPSYEVKEEYQTVAEFIPRLHARWPEAEILLWYPVLEAGRHTAMLERLNASGLPCVGKDETLFPEHARLRMRGSGVWWCARSSTPS